MKGNFIEINLSPLVLMIYSQLELKLENTKSG